MTSIELKKSLFIIFPLAFLSIAIWLFEITKVVGWSSLDWIYADLMSPYLICCFAAICFMTPIVLKYQKIDGKIILTFLTLSLINIVAFFLAELFFKGIYSRNPLVLSDKNTFYCIGLLTFLGFALSYYCVTHYLIVNIPKLFAFIFATSEILMFILGVITAYCIRGFGTGYSLFDAVKMGYPQVWICILLGLIGIFVLYKNAEVTEQ